MAESTSIVNRQLLFDGDGDTPIPAAEVLIGLKRGSNHVKTRYGAQSSSLRKNHAHSRSTTANHKPRSSLRQFVEDESDSDEESKDVTNSPPYKRSKRTGVQRHSHSQPKLQQLEINGSQSWKRPLRTFLRLPKALSWCRYEWFCSDIDRLFLEDENDFAQCLDQMFPNMKTRLLSAVQWRIIRKTIGKPRRCSRVFFSEERALLAEKRSKVRTIQRKIHQGTLTSADFHHLHDVPDAIPGVLTVGTKVTAYLSSEKDKGFHTGTVEAVDLDHNQYWILFDKPDIGKSAVPDTDLLPSSSCDYISLSSLKVAHSNRQLITAATASSTATSSTTVATYSSSSSAQPSQLHSNSSTNTSGKIPPQPNPEVPDPLLPSSPLVSRTRLSSDQSQEHDHQQQSLGGFPMDLLRQVVEMSKLLGLKQSRVRNLSMLNKEAEKMHARHVPLTQTFQKQYATIVIDLDDINKQLNLRSEAVKKYCAELGYEDEPYQLSNSMECLQRAQEIIASSNERLRATGSEVTSDNTLALISKLTSLLLQIELLSQGDRSHDLSGLQSSISETLQYIHTDNHKVFQKNIETPLALIQSGMNPSDSLHPFSVTIPKKTVRTTTNSANNSNMSTSTNYSPRRLK